ncbi:MAG: WD40 repeat domain-containing protein, partial [Verrucomicrobiae bacterium]|nr:WD40 repeat domain-containing protein [Verrucomicrobiae bacterium]
SHVGEPTLRADSLHFAADRVSLSAFDNQTTFLIWNLATGTERKFSLPYRPTTFSVTPDLHWLAVANSDLQGAGQTHVSLLDLTTGLWRTLDVGIKPFHVAWHPDARRLVVGLTDFRIGIWDLSRPTLPPAMLMGHGGNVEHSAFSPGGDWLLTSGFDNSMRLWDVERSRPLAFWTSQVLAVQFSPDHRHLGYTTLAADELVRLRVERGGVCQTLAESDPHPSQGPFQAHFLAGGRLLACAARDGGRIFDTVTGRQLAHLAGGPAYGGGVSPNEDALLLMNGAEGSVARWPIERVSALEWRFGPPATVPPPAGGFTLVSPEAGVVTVHPTQGILLPKGNSPEPLNDSIGCRPIALSADQRWLAGATATGIKIWDAGSNGVVERWAISNVLSGAFSSSGAWLAVIQSDRLVVLDVGSGAKRWETPGVFSSDPSQTFLAPPAFSPDGRLLAVIHSASRVALHDAATGELLAFIAHPEFEPLASVAFSADSGQLAVVCSTHLVQLWDLRRLRSELAALGLDWTHPPLPPAPEQQGEARVVVEY